MFSLHPSKTRNTLLRLNPAASALLVLLAFFAQTNNCRAQHEIHGVVLDDQKKPLTNAHVLAYQNKTIKKDATTDTGGHFELKNLALGAYKILIAASAYDSVWLYDVPVKETAETKCEIVMSRDGEGRVTYVRVFKKPTDTDYVNTEIISNPEPSPPTTAATDDQNKATTPSKQNGPLRGILYIEPLALIDLYGTSIRVGTEVYIAHGWALSGTGGAYFFRSTGYINGWMVKGELKKYLWAIKKDNKRTAQGYLSLEYFYKHMAYALEDSIQIPPNYYAHYLETKNIHALRLKYGVVAMRKHRIIIDQYMGLGIRYRAATTNLSPEEEKHIFYNVESNIVKMTESISTGVRLDLSLGIKVGWRY